MKNDFKLITRTVGHHTSINCNFPGWTIQSYMCPGTMPWRIVIGLARDCPQKLSGNLLVAMARKTGESIPSICPISLASNLAHCQVLVCKSQACHSFICDNSKILNMPSSWLLPTREYQLSGKGKLID